MGLISLLTMQQTPISQNIFDNSKIYTGSQDRTIKVYTAVEGKLCRTLEGHSHWVSIIG